MIDAKKHVGSQAEGIGAEYVKTDLCSPAGLGNHYVLQYAADWLPPDYTFANRLQGSCAYKVGGIPRRMSVGGVAGSHPIYTRKTFGGDYHYGFLTDPPDSIKDTSVAANREALKKYLLPDNLKSTPGAYCCLKQPQGGLCPDGTTCDPKYNSGPQAEGCVETFKTYCSEGDRVFADGRCKQWSLAFPTPAFDAVRTYCNNNPLDPNCRVWAESGDPKALAAHKLAVRAKSAEAGAIEKDPRWLEQCRAKGYRGLCNTGAISYCEKLKRGELSFLKPATAVPPKKSAGARYESMVEDVAAREKATKFCACINSAAGRFNTECVDADCADWGYKTTEEVPQCNITSCDIVFNIDKTGGDVRLLNNDFIQNCMTAQEKKAEADRKKQEDIDRAAEDAANDADKLDAAADDAAKKAADAQALADKLAVDAEMARDKAAETKDPDDIADAEAIAKHAADAAEVAKKLKEDAEEAEDAADDAGKRADLAAENAAAAKPTLPGLQPTDDDADEEGTSSSTDDKTIYYVLGGGAIFLLAAGILGYFLSRR